MLFFISYYFLYIRFQAAPFLYAYWSEFFLPLNLYEYPKFIKDTLLNVYSGFIPHADYNTYYRFTLLPLLIFISCIGLYYCFKNKRDMFIICFSSLIIYILLSLFRIYPFGHGGVIGGRLSLFMSPIFYISCCYGFVCLHKSRKGMKIFTNVLLLLLIAIAISNKRGTFYGQQTHNLISKIKQESNLNDCILIYGSSMPAFRYYSFLENCHAQYITFNNKNSLVNEIKTCKNNDIWILASHHPNEIHNQIKQASKKGEIIETVGAILGKITR